ncbi:VOC family protein [Ancylobacter sp. 6x-1]|uniref:VOC family protein n=1 Tax=Ancylobacter crimeensis TaxID=2579147 RepID=A0ABT0DAC1_9HYPH|nr:VOC family protein [Ancylobacter crimeensis]MCK0196905.1 VOC family protein [Ancylobacter crimeensis]
MSDDLTLPEHGTFVWNELRTWDVASAKAFYGTTLGWTFEEMPMEEGAAPYWVCLADEEMVAGILPMTSADFEGTPSHWFAYVEVDDVDVRVALVEEAGGTVVRPPFDVPGVGRMAIVKAPDGASIGWITSAWEEEEDEEDDEDDED